MSRTNRFQASQLANRYFDVACAANWIGRSSRSKKRNRGIGGSCVDDEIVAAPLFTFRDCTIVDAIDIDGRGALDIEGYYVVLLFLVSSLLRFSMGPETTKPGCDHVEMFYTMFSDVRGSRKVV